MARTEYASPSLEWTSPQPLSALWIATTGAALEWLLAGHLVRWSGRLAWVLEWWISSLNEPRALRGSGKFL